ncbi:MAG: hypothetical protein LBI69_05125 [Puniceicoccales bacterium]|jgi:hypothetical protein|nr:hypothetical protein [Puniceicoccales bacterium]
MSKCSKLIDFLFKPLNYDGVVSLKNENCSHPISAAPNLLVGAAVGIVSAAVVAGILLTLAYAAIPSLAGISAYLLSIGSVGSVIGISSACVFLVATTLAIVIKHYVARSKNLDYNYKTSSKSPMNAANPDRDELEKETNIEKNLWEKEVEIEALQKKLNEAHGESTRLSQSVDAAAKLNKEMNDENIALNNQLKVLQSNLNNLTIQNEMQLGISKESNAENETTIQNLREELSSSAEELKKLKNIALDNFNEECEKKFNDCVKFEILLEKVNIISGQKEVNDIDYGGILEKLNEKMLELTIEFQTRINMPSEINISNALNYTEKVIGSINCLYEANKGNRVVRKELENLKSALMIPVISIGNIKNIIKPLNSLDAIYKKYTDGKFGIKGTDSIHWNINKLGLNSVKAQIYAVIKTALEIMNKLRVLQAATHKLIAAMNPEALTRCHEILESKGAILSRQIDKFEDESARANTADIHAKAMAEKNIIKDEISVIELEQERSASLRQLVTDCDEKNKNLAKCMEDNKKLVAMTKASTSLAEGLQMSLGKNRPINCANEAENHTCELFIFLIDGVIYDLKNNKLTQKSKIIDALAYCRSAATNQQSSK